MVSAIVFVANGTEESEFTITVDVLRRANVKVNVVGVQLTEMYATCSRGVKIVPDTSLEELQDWETYDAAVIPGGLKGAETLRDDKKVKHILSTLYEHNKVVAFICAGTLAAKEAHIGKGREATSYPAFKTELSEYYKYSEDRVVVDENLVTSRGPGTAFLFALTLVEKLIGKEMSLKLQKEMLTASVL
ncbi:class I glutamine amidotransferase-like protein [Halteromyces radiatus]|uniref:class I glutamine amidotransferase-like protein n=1 Tax=Halteromyces radiatus TaxID=101107 RepID=UPI00221EC451|nr:class I glutamine amidotransferase-like protein [Halteromyces radiatus]KAI8097133.1 class I glutamine amidotransferase-like protein [Halteromyces radiatus]